MKLNTYCAEFVRLLSVAAWMLVAGTVYAQNNPAPEIRKLLLEEYKKSKKPEISFEEFLKINSHVYTDKAATASKSIVAAAVGDPYCSKVRPYCTNSDFETGLDQSQYTGAYGLWDIDLYPDPFATSNFSFGFNSGELFNGSAHQTIVASNEGADIYTGISLVPPLGGSKAIRLGNAVNGAGTEILAKTVKVDANETILGFFYSVVFEDPDHDFEDQPAFSVRVYDCATGDEILNVCNLGNGSNTVVSDVDNPFFKTANFGSIAYRDWSLGQIDLSKQIGKTVIIVFTNKDCNLYGHFGYTYLDNLFSKNCPKGTTTEQGSIALDSTKLDTCGAGQICTKYTLPFVVDNAGVRTTGSAKVFLDVYQNGSSAAVKTLSSPKLTKDSSSYCFTINPQTIGVKAGSLGFDYVIRAEFIIGSDTSMLFDLGANPPSGFKPGTNNDYLLECVNPMIYYSKATGNLHNTTTWGNNPDGSGNNPSDFGAGKTFMLANRATFYDMTANWTIGGALNIPPGGQLRIGNFTLSIDSLFGGGSLNGTTGSKLTVTGGPVFLRFASNNNKLANLLINSGATTTLSTTLQVYNVLQVQSGTLNTGGRLVLKSNSSTTARVAQVTGTISGSTTVERYIPARRAWRLIAAPVSGSQTINQGWQEGATTTSANPAPGYGTHITGVPYAGSQAKGFDLNSPQALASIKKYDNASGNWIPYDNTNNTRLGNKAIMLFVRGDRSISLGDTSIIATNTTLRAKGALKTGTQNFSVAAAGFTAVPNPFASPIDFRKLSKSVIQNNFYVWDPKLGGANGVGKFINVSWNGTSYEAMPTPLSPISEIIQSGQAFMVQAKSGGGTLSIPETAKSASAAANVFGIVQNDALAQSGGTSRLSGQQGLKVYLQVDDVDGTRADIDGVFLSYNSMYSDALDEMDIAKLENFDENLAIVRTGKALLVERRSLAAAEDDVALKLWNTTARSYLFRFEPLNLSSSMYYYLKDRYLQTTTQIDVSKTSELRFTINSNPASASADRFSLMISDKMLQGISRIPDVLTVAPNPVRGRIINLTIKNQPAGLYQVQVVNGLGQQLYRGQITNAGGTSNQAIKLNSKLPQGVYLLQISKGNTIHSVKVVSE